MPGEGVGSQNDTKSFRILFWFFSLDLREITTISEMLVLSTGYRYLREVDKSLSVSSVCQIPTVLP